MYGRCILDRMGDILALCGREPKPWFYVERVQRLGIMWKGSKGLALYGRGPKAWYYVEEIQRLGIMGKAV